MGEKNSGHAHKTGPGNILGIVFKISDMHPRRLLPATVRETSLRSSPELNRTWDR